MWHTSGLLLLTICNLTQLVDPFVVVLLPRVSHGRSIRKRQHRGTYSDPQRPVHHGRALWLSDRCVQMFSDGIMSQPKRCRCGGCDIFRGVWTSARWGQRLCSCTVLPWQQCGADLHQCVSRGEDYLQPDVSEPVSISRVILRRDPEGVVPRHGSHVTTCECPTLLRPN